MKLISIVIEKLYGKLSYDIKFNDTLNIMVGINGSGKTSIFYIVKWLLEPNIGELCTIRFSKIDLSFSIGKKTYNIVCEQSKHVLTLSVKDGKKRGYHPLIAPLELSHERLHEDFKKRAQVLDEYRKLSPDKREQKTWRFIKSLNKPQIITLERTLSLDKKEDEYEAIRAISRKSLTRSEVLRTITGEAYGKYRSSIINSNSELQNRIILSSFDLGGKNLKSLTPKKTSEYNISSIEEKFNKLMTEECYFYKSKDNKFIEAFKKTAKHYFNEARTSNIDNITIEYERIQKLLDLFLAFEATANDAFLPIKTFLDTVNSYLIDSKKLIFFDESTNNLYFRYIDNSSEKIDIEYLSSGERQVLTLLSYAAFFKGTTILIDEPELSLHPRWQEIFISSLDRLMPPDTQIILATHSPSLVGTNLDKVISLDENKI